MFHIKYYGGRKFTKSVHKILLDHLQIDMEKITFENQRGANKIIVLL